jgi:hypothetical protein
MVEEMGGVGEHTAARWFSFLEVKLFFFIPSSGRKR